MEDHHHQCNPNMEGQLQQYEVNTFGDFVTRNPHITIPVLGKRYTLDALHNTVSAGFYAQQARLDNHYPAYTPLVVALNTICAEMNTPFVTEAELYSMQFMSWFDPFAKEFIKDHHAQHLLNVDNFIDAQGPLTEDNMVLLVAAFAYYFGCGSIGLGIVTLVKGQPVRAFHYPTTNKVPNYTAWIVADFRTNEHLSYGIGSKVNQEQRASPRQEQEPLEDIGDEADDETTPIPATTPRKTADRVLKQQIPLPAGLTADDILRSHKDQLQYNNILKVALVFDNHKIVTECKSDSLPKGQKIQHASAVVKRINTAVNWIEEQYEMDTGAFRTAYDRQRRENAINIRGKEAVSDAVMAVNSLKIELAMEWIKLGGPRPDSNDAPYATAATTVTTAPLDYVPPPTPTVLVGFLGSDAAPDWLGGADITTDGDMRLNDLHGTDEMDDIVMGDDFGFNADDFDLQGFVAEQAEEAHFGLF